MGLVYLLCLGDTHYCGWAKNYNHLRRRLAAHAAGHGSAHTAHHVGLGKTITCVRLFRGTVDDEARLKKRGPKNFCPRCSPYRSVIRSVERASVDVASSGRAA